MSDGVDLIVNGKSVHVRGNGATPLLQVLRNLVNLLGIPSSLDFAVMGAVILIGVMADQIFTERRIRRQVTLMRETSAH